MKKTVAQITALTMAAAMALQGMGNRGRRSYMDIQVKR